MRILGKRVRRVPLVRTHNLVVAVEVEAVIPEDDTSEPCHEAETVQLLREVEEHAQRGDIKWLQQQGRVYQALEDSPCDGSDGSAAAFECRTSHVD